VDLIKGSHPKIETIVAQGNSMPSERGLASSSVESKFSTDQLQPRPQQSDKASTQARIDILGRELAALIRQSALQQVEEDSRTPKAD
jgi:hypothetical protein